jgi:hypothetical protein
LKFNHPPRLDCFLQPSPARVRFIPSSLLRFRSFHSTQNMHPLRLLGLLDGIPATFSINPSFPQSVIAEAFLFRHHINPLVSASGRNFLKTSFAVPSLGGFYSSNGLILPCSISYPSDVVLAADWLSASRPVLRGNTIGLPSSSSVERLSYPHEWSADGTFFSLSFMINGSMPPIFSWLTTTIVHMWAPFPCHRIPLVIRTGHET